MGGDGRETKQCTLDVINTHRGLLFGRELEANRKLFAYNLPIIHPSWCTVLTACWLTGATRKKTEAATKKATSSAKEREKKPILKLMIIRAVQSSHAIASFFAMPFFMLPIENKMW